MENRDVCLPEEDLFPKVVKRRVGEMGGGV